MPPDVCKDSEMLRARLGADARVYGDAVARLVLATGDAFKQAYERARMARRACRLAEKRLKEHTEQHHCESAKTAEVSSRRSRQVSPSAPLSPERRS
jgi:phosphoglycerate-specific signal transduction histidine kinase